MSINIDDGILSCAIGDMPPILKPVKKLLLKSSEYNLYPRENIFYKYSWEH